MGNHAPLFASFGGRTTQRVSLGMLVATVIALLAACGGGGGSDTPAATPAVTPPTVTAQSVKISGVKIGLVSINGAEVTPDEPAVISVEYDAGGAQGAASMAVSCGGNPVATAVASATASKIEFSHNPWLIGSCSGSATVSAPGFTSATVSFSFTVKAPAPTVLRYNEAVLLVLADGTLGQLVVDTVKPSGYAVKKAVNKTSYTSGVAFPLGLCATVWTSDGSALMKQPDGALVVSCVTPAAGYLRRYFAFNPVDSSIGTEIEAPAGAILRDVAYAVSTKYAAQGVSGNGRFAETNSGVFYITDMDSINLRFAPGGDFSKSTIVGSDGYQFMVTASN